MKKILVVDDNDINRELLCILFQDQYEVLEANNGQRAMEIIQKKKEELVLIFLDLVMPVKSGIDVLNDMNTLGLTDTIPVIVTTGEATVESDEQAYEYGAADIMYKPISRRVITKRAQNLIELYEQRNRMEESLKQKNKELLAFQDKLERTNEFLIDALSSVVEFRSLESGEHIKRVKLFTKTMLETWKKMHPECHFSKEDIKLMTNASALHDIGKIGIPDSILLKPGRFTKEEYEIMKTHTTIGCDILDRFKMDDSDFFTYCWDICRYHHERYDGKGYPDGLCGDQIPIWAQIVAIVDVFDALISPRVYKEAYSVEQAMQMIRDGECGVFSPKIIACFERAKPKLLQVAGHC